MALAVAMSGCAGDVDELDRVQPGYVTKADLLGSHWYYRRTVVDAPENFGAYASIGTGDLFTIERIRWETAIQTSDPHLKINNNHRAYYARLWMKRNPEHKGFFRTRVVAGSMGDTE